MQAQRNSESQRSLIETLFAPDRIGGSLLILATAAALIWANSGASDSYDAVWGAKFAIEFEGFKLAKPLILWINDFLMAIFFLLVALELKSEFVNGQFNTPRKAAVPAIAAIGGMIVPAAIFAAIALNTPAISGWGIPIGTDTAFALGFMRMLGKRVPDGLPVFLTASAIIDDVGAILIITIFYAQDISIEALAIAGGLTLALIVMNRLGCRRLIGYLILGAVLWLATLKSGIHATVTGVILGLCIPADTTQEDSRHGAIDGSSPLERLEHALAPWVNLAIIPLFALANAGVRLEGMSLADLASPAALGVVLGLVFGKQIGIFLATFAAVRGGIGSLPAEVSWRHLYGLSILSGIGFTMSLFITSLAFGEGSQLAEQAKLAILIGLPICAIAGMSVLAGAKPVTADTAERARTVRSR